MKIYICGDSTAASYGPEDAPLTGWGQALDGMIDGAEVVNRAMAGRSTKSFLYEGRLQRIETEIAPGDVMLIQFTHNDEGDLLWRRTEAWTSFENNLELFIDTALRNGARPVLLTPICLRDWRDGALTPSHGDYLRVVRMLAARRGVPLIDLYQASYDAVSAMGDEASRKLYMHLEKGVYPRWPDGQTDDCHTQRAGAELYAKFVAGELVRLFPNLSMRG